MKRNVWYESGIRNSSLIEFAQGLLCVIWMYFRRVRNEIRQTLARLARADLFGRETPDAKGRIDPEGDRFMEITGELKVRDHAPPDVVRGRHLIARGMKPGPRFGEILQS